MDNALNQYGIELYINTLPFYIGSDGLHLGFCICNELEMRRDVQPHGVTSVFHFLMTMESTEGSSA